MSEKMNPEVKERWLAALRSGDYEQGRARLRRDGQHCCLGVLCDISGLGAWDEIGRYSVGDDGSLCYLPEAVRAWAGLNSYNPDLPAGQYLANLNDEGMPFERIADIIERYF